MKLKIDRGSDRLMAWTDKKDGYLLLSTAAADGPESGYWRGETKYLSDFFVPMTGDAADLYRTNAQYTEVRPDGFTSFFFSGDLSLSVSLLIGERAFFVSCDGSPSAGILFARALPGVAAWDRSDSDGITCRSCHLGDTGVAIASTAPFALETASDNRACLFSASDNPSWYLTFDRTREAARDHARALAARDAVEAHRAKVSSFLDSCSIESGDVRFDDAERWSRFSAWMLSVDGEGASSGPAVMWGGLPWFRESWSRDTFVALCGSLLVPARFAEARSILVSAARSQNRDRSSPEYGRLPNRDRGADNRIYNSADGTLWFIRAVSEYIQYSGDHKILSEVGGAIDVALEADRTRRCDEQGFLLHADGETWMDAMAPSGAPYSPRGDRACEIQALWYTALLAGASFARMAGDEALAEEREGLALRVRKSFRRAFWSESRASLADCLSSDGREGLEPDWRVRPNQLLAISVPSVLPDGTSDLLERERQTAVVDNATRELSSPAGLFSLCPDDPLFHPTHADCEFHRKDAAYHNGTVWLWTTGPYVTACARSARSATLPPIASALLSNEASMILDSRCVGALDALAQAESDPLGKPVFTGVWSQARSEAEFCRNVWQDVVGFKPRLAENRIEIKPCLPAAVSRMRARAAFGPCWFLDIELSRDRNGGTVSCSLLWNCGTSASAAGLSAASLSVTGASLSAANLSVTGASGASPVGSVAANALPRLTANGVPLLPSTPLELTFVDETIDSPDRGDGRGDIRANGSRADNVPSRPFLSEYGIGRFPERDLRNDWCVAIHETDALERLVTRAVERFRPSGAGGAAGLSGAASAHRANRATERPSAIPCSWLKSERVLERYFDSDRFKRKYLTNRVLGASYGIDKTVFRLWAPTARSVILLLYPDGDASPPSAVLQMEGGPCAASSEGVWELSLAGDLHGSYYRFRVRAHGIVRETADPYARACGVNGVRSMVVDFARANPAGWKAASAPALRAPNDAVVYEAHVADLTSSPTWNGDPRARRTYAGATVRGTSVSGVPSGFDHIRSLGITHVQLMPVFDFSSVDEASSGGSYNWGYDPFLWSSPEGSYSSDPRNGAVRVVELKAMLRDFLAGGIGVVMDVVYNHVPRAADHPFGICAPGYYFRAESQSGAGDDTASERAMFSRFMVDSLSWWLSEYKLSGFRFDLMGLHDVETMNSVSSALRGIKEDVLLYGEGWDMYRGGKMVAASMHEARKLHDFGFFNDAFRCGVKGPVFSPDSAGFIHDGSFRESLKFGLVGAVYHPQVHNRQVEGTANRNPWSERTAASVNFAEIHDNLTLYDKLALTEPGKGDEWYGRLQRMAIALVLVAQGMPVLHAGMEFMRTKEIPAETLARMPDANDVSTDRSGLRAFSHNSYNLPDSINGLDWARCAGQSGLVEYVRGLIALRRDHPAFRLRTEREVCEALSFVDAPAPLLAWVIDGGAVGDEWKRVFVAVNPGFEPVTVSLPARRDGLEWRLVADGRSFGADFTDLVEPKALYLYAEF